MNTETKEILLDIINNFSPDKFTRFFREKNKDFTQLDESIDSPLYPEHFIDGKIIGEIEFTDDGQALVVCAFKSIKELSERSSKKQQYDIAKNVLTIQQRYDAGIFIFYDENGNFRFSLVYNIYQGKKSALSHFKRFTYYVSKDQTNKTFLKQIGEGDFSSLENIKEAFSVEKVTREFYQELSNWYFWALRNVKFPDGVEVENNGRNIALIRLITRLIFIWFMKQKDIMPDRLFNYQELQNILKDLSPNESTIYKAILQNLFFATLSCKQEERRFAEDARWFGKGIGGSKDYGNQYAYRYKELFKISEKEVLDLFKDIPFLNGGIFEMLDDKESKIYIDGFTRLEKYQPVVPNFLFFSEEQTVDLSEDYGEAKYKRAKVRGLINILRSYNFTIDENTPIDEEVALDPELLGKVFENLLASYNPETATTARKATGSYYTPREIVDYMVNESLKEYFKTKFPNITEQKLEELFSYHSLENSFDEETTNKLINAIHNLKIIDPAVGSGAFPMGILHKLVHILSKLDPHNEKWKEEQIKAVEKNVTDPTLKKALIQRIEESFTQNELDYGRKLYLIQNCIYGVDIQPIAIQIAKLRFFISLLVDEKVDKTKPDWGIEPLPNLETKFVAANTLIGLPVEPYQCSKMNEIINLEKELFEIRKEHFSTFDIKRKQQIVKKDAEIRQKLKKLIDEYTRENKEKVIKLRQELEKLSPKYEFVKDVFNKEQMIDVNEAKRKEIQSQIENLENFIKQDEILLKKYHKIAEFDIYNTNKFADWFDPEWMFGVRDGFDIVIANPPYVRQEKIKELKSILKNQNYEVFNSTSDLYVYFYEKGYQLLKEKGILCFISSNKWMRAKYGERLRKFFKEKTTVKELIDFGGHQVFEATVDTNIILFQKRKPDEKHQVNYLNVSSEFDGNLEEYKKEKSGFILQKELNDNAWTLADEKILALKKKIEKIGTPLKDWDVGIYFGIKTGLNEAFIIDSQKREEILRNCQSEDERKKTEEIIKPILRGRDIFKWGYKWAGLWMIATFPALRLNIEEYPAVKKYFLDNFDIRQLEQSGKKYPELGFNARKKTGNKWFETQDNIAYYPEFEKEKIVWQHVSGRYDFAFVPEGMYLTNALFMITGEPTVLKYIMAVLNSKFADYLLLLFTNLTTLGEYAYGAKDKIEQLPIPRIPETDPSYQKLLSLVDQILRITEDVDSYQTDLQKQAQAKELEKQIDQLVYKLYGLTEEEIKLIENKFLRV